MDTVRYCFYARPEMSGAERSFLGRRRHVARDTQAVKLRCTISR
jgi:hypothetical protein